METTTYESSSAMGAMFGTFMLFWLIVSVFMIICMWKIYTKAGQEGWAAIVPFYNIYILTKIVGKPWWWLLLCFVPIANIVVAIWMTNLLSKSFGKSEGFTIGLIFLGIVFYPILAFDRTITYQGPAGDPNRFMNMNINEELGSIGK
ncbi:DUF5684 domain-containing protein [Chitinophaga sp. 212800010-3]|uniref:DUF5684 domain-containing protein n=1 Tax=unclassified Chitinophaga TaxID=2619133 RepID=UPI002DEC4EB9|nr:Signal peptidase I [Chitinophaga sp. 212800010-3]